MYLAGIALQAVTTIVITINARAGDLRMAGGLLQKDGTDLGMRSTSSIGQDGPTGRRFVDITFAGYRRR
jgi:hypothetical protein